MTIVGILTFHWTIDLFRTLEELHYIHTIPFHGVPQGHSIFYWVDIPFTNYTTHSLNSTPAVGTIHQTFYLIFIHH